jgi:membrane carboxypeptidase/penicillin-binding protein
MQRAANEAVTEGLREYDRRRGYRGPAESLKTKEEIDAFMAETDKGLSGRPLSPSAAYRGVVTAVNTKKNQPSLSVDIGSLHGAVESQDLEWTRLYNPTKEPDGGNGWI